MKSRLKYVHPTITVHPFDMSSSYMVDTSKFHVFIDGEEPLQIGEPGDGSNGAKPFADFDLGDGLQSGDDVLLDESCTSDRL